MGSTPSKGAPPVGGKTTVQRICIDQMSGSIQPRASPSSSTYSTAEGVSKRGGFGPLAERIRNSATGMRKGNSAGAGKERDAPNLRGQLDVSEKRRQEAEGFIRVLKREISSLQARNVELAEEVMLLREKFHRDRSASRLNNPDTPPTAHFQPTPRQSSRRKNSLELEDLLLKSRMEKELYEKLVAKLQSEMRHQNREWSDRVDAGEATLRVLEGVIKAEFGETELARLKGLAGEVHSQRRQKGSRDDGIVSLDSSFSSSDSLHALPPKASSSAPEQPSQQAEPPKPRRAIFVASAKDSRRRPRVASGVARSRPRPHTSLPVRRSAGDDAEINMESIKLMGKEIGEKSERRGSDASRSPHRLVPIMGHQSAEFVQRRRASNQSNNSCHDSKRSSNSEEDSDADTLKDYLLAESGGDEEESEDVEADLRRKKGNADPLSNSLPSGALSRRLQRPTTATPLASQRRRLSATLEDRVQSTSAKSRDSGYLDESQHSRRRIFEQ